jgi:hypothetical protein
LIPALPLLCCSALAERLPPSEWAEKFLELPGDSVAGKFPAGQ